MNARFALTGLALFGLVLGATSSDSDAAAPLGSFRVTASVLNVRTGPSTRNRAILQIRSGQVYPGIRRQGVWVQLQIGDRTGWSHGGFLAGASNQVRDVTASALNVRTGPSTRNRRIGSLSRGDSISIRGSSGVWVRFNYEGRDAWVHGGFLTGGAARPAPAPAPSNPNYVSDGRRSRAGFIHMAASGPGFVAYGQSHKRWGLPALVYGAERVGRRWAQEQRARFRVGNVSLENGGQMPPHSSHRRGEDMDVAPVRNDGAEAPVTRFQSTYSRTRTRRLIELFRSEVRARTVLFNDTAIPGVTRFSGHDNHFHYRMQQ